MQFDLARSRAILDTAFIPFSVVLKIRELGPQLRETHPRRHQLGLGDTHLLGAAERRHERRLVGARLGQREARPRDVFWTFYKWYEAKWLTSQYDAGQRFGKFGVSRRASRR